ncbi:hypothetical protein DFS34DRAFT_379026 [Phlyctochytrium arcticum]|nr:hypothetical protein DFS34DRAFT_379026 [Phlyctochytrium arcticum]
MEFPSGSGLGTFAAATVIALAVLWQSRRTTATTPERTELDMSALEEVEQEDGPSFKSAQDSNSPTSSTEPSSTHKVTGDIDEPAHNPLATTTTDENKAEQLSLLSSVRTRLETVIDHNTLDEIAHLDLDDASGEILNSSSQNTEQNPVSESEESPCPEAQKSPQEESGTFEPVLSSRPCEENDQVALPKELHLWEKHAVVQDTENVEQTDDGLLPTPKAEEMTPVHEPEPSPEPRSDIPSDISDHPSHPPIVENVVTKSNPQICGDSPGAAALTTQHEPCTPLDARDNSISEPKPDPIEEPIVTEHSEPNSALLKDIPPERSDDEAGHSIKEGSDDPDALTQSDNFLTDNGLTTLPVQELDTEGDDSTERVWSDSGAEANVKDELGAARAGRWSEVVPTNVNTARGPKRVTHPHPPSLPSANDPSILRIDTSATLHKIEALEFKRRQYLSRSASDEKVATASEVGLASMAKIEELERRRQERLASKTVSVVEGLTNAPRPNMQKIEAIERRRSGFFSPPILDYEHANGKSSPPTIRMQRSTSSPGMMAHALAPLPSQILSPPLTPSIARAKGTSPTKNAGADGTSDIDVGPAAENTLHCELERREAQRSMDEVVRRRSMFMEKFERTGA